MENEQLSAGSGVTHNPGHSLKQLVDGLVGNSLPLAKDNGSRIVNEVGGGVFLQTVNQEMADLMDQVLRTVVINSRRGDIHITSESYQGNLVLTIQERNNYNGYALSFSLGSLMPVAEELGGLLDIKCAQKLVTTVSLSFPGQVAA